MTTKRVLCKHWLHHGNCTYPNCTFAHGSFDLNSSVPLCTFADRCKNGSHCTYRHLTAWGTSGTEKMDVRFELTISNKKTKLCDNWKKGCCSHFDKMTCSFAHGSEDLNECVPMCPQYRKYGACDNADLCDFRHKHQWEYKYFCVETMSLAEKKSLFAYLKSTIENEEADTDDIEVKLASMEI